MNGANDQVLDADRAGAARMAHDWVPSPRRSAASIPFGLVQRRDQVVDKGAR
jgi:hypothetical protein